MHSVITVHSQCCTFIIPTGLPLADTSVYVEIFYRLPGNEDFHIHMSLTSSYVFSFDVV